MRLKSAIIALVITTSGSLSTAPQAEAAAVNITSLMFGSEDSKWRSYTYGARDAVETLNGLSSRTAEVLHNTFDMEQRLPWERALFLATIGQVQTRGVWATSIMAHEYAHFASAHAYGLTDHYFMDDKTGEVFGTGKALRHTFLYGNPGGPAMSQGDGSKPNLLESGQGVEMSLAGLNWQMGYSETRMRGWLSGERRTVFDAADLLINRGYLMAYAIGSHLDVNSAEENADPKRFVSEIEGKYGTSNVSEKMILTSIAANIASVGLSQAMNSFGMYVSHGDLIVEPSNIVIGGGHQISWDIPHYLNKASMTLSPTVYWTPSPEYSDLFYADQLLLGFGVETSVIGKRESEVRATLDGKWDNFEFNSGLSLSQSGAYLELKSSYAVSESFSLTSGAVFKAGETMRGARDLADANHISWVGGELRF
jgi:hypothetical protein